MPKSKARPFQHWMKTVMKSPDGYKLSQKDMYIDGTTVVGSYFESRTGAKFPATVFLV